MNRDTLTFLQVRTYHTLLLQVHNIDLVLHQARFSVSELPHLQSQCFHQYLHINGHLHNVSTQLTSQ